MNCTLCPGGVAGNIKNKMPRREEILLGKKDEFFETQR
jgi:hypothetical protein